MGNTNSSHPNHTHSHQPYHPAFHREIRNGHLHYPPGPPTHLEPGVCNPEYKVLPERIPGQKLRITDNGNILQNGGTISGKSPAVITPLANEAEFLRVLENRRTQVDSYNPHVELANSRYYSNPDLMKQNKQYDGSRDANTNSSHRKFFKKSKAPPPPPMAHPMSNESAVNRASSFKDPVTGTIVKIHPWEQRQETWCIGVPSQMRAAASMERILEHRDFKPEMQNNFRTNQDWRFYKNSDPRNNNTKPHHQLNGNAQRYGGGSIDRQMNDKRYRAQSMDSLQTSPEKLMNGRLRQSLESLNKCIIEPNKLDTHHRLRGSQENLNNRKVIERHEEILRPSSRQSAHSSSSLLRSAPSNSNDRWAYRSDFKSPVERSSSADTRRIGSSITKTEMLLQRKDSSPQQYYFGEVESKQESNSPVNYLSKEQLAQNNRPSSALSHHMHRLESKNSGSWLSEELRSPSNKVSLSPQESNRLTDITSNELINKDDTQETFLTNSSNGRQRNSYAFEDKRYRYELDAQSRNLKPMLELSVENSDEEDINMHLRPTLPKRVPALPRFSPTQAWRSLNLEHITSAQQTTNTTSADDVQEDSIRRITRPVAPPRVGNERSADSGISQDAGSPGLANDFDLVHAGDKVKSNSPPLCRYPENCGKESFEMKDYKPQNRPSTWTPEEDLTSDFDGVNYEHPVTATNSVPQMISVPPKLMSIKHMFSANTILEDDKRGTKGAKKMLLKPADSNSSITFTSVKKLKRSSSGALPGQEGVDENWSFSRSLPNSLHNGAEGEKDAKEKANTAQFNTAMQRIASGPIALSARAGLQNRVMSLDSLNTNSYQRVHYLNNNRTKDDLFMKYSPSEHIIYLPEYDAKKIILSNGSAVSGEMYGNVVYVGYNSKKPKKFTFQSTVRQQERRKIEQQLSQMAEVSEKNREKEKKLVNLVEEEFQKKREREKATICQQLKLLSNNNADNGIDGCEGAYPPMSPTQIYSREELYEKPFENSGYVNKNQTTRTDKESGLFGGISKWMRRQQKLEDHHKASRQEPEGAPSPSAQQDGTGKNAIHDQSNHIIVASRYPNANLDAGGGGNGVYIKMRESVETNDSSGKQGSNTMKSIGSRTSNEGTDNSSDFEERDIHCSERNEIFNSKKSNASLNKEAQHKYTPFWRKEPLRGNDKHSVEKKVSR